MFDTADPAIKPAGDTRTIGQRRHDALIEAIRQSLAAGGLPSAGGVKPQVVITIPWTSLRDRTGAGRLADGTPISPSLTRQLADDADLIPVYLSPTGIPLDVGRRVRLFAGRIRTALETRDRGCAWPGYRTSRLAEGDSERASQRGTSEERSERGAEQCNGRRRITSAPGSTADRPTWTTASCCAFSTHHEIDKADWTVTIRNGRA